MFIKPIEIPVCKPCPKCGMPTIYEYPENQYHKSYYMIMCKSKCCYVNNLNGCDAATAINAWNTMITGIQPPESPLPYQQHIVQFHRESHPISKFGKATNIPWFYLSNLDVHTRQQIIHDETRRAYHKIADELYESGIGEVKFYSTDFNDDILLNVTLQVVDNRKATN